MEAGFTTFNQRQQHHRFHVSHEIHVAAVCRASDTIDSVRSLSVHVSEFSKLGLCDLAVRIIRCQQPRTCEVSSQLSASSRSIRTEPHLPLV